MNELDRATMVSKRRIIYKHRAAQQVTSLKEKTHVNRSQMPLPPHRRRRHVEPRLVAEPVEARPPAPAFLQVQSDGRGLQLRERVQEPRPGGGEEGSRGADDRLAGLVAGGLRPLRPVVHSHGVAQRRHLPHRRRPRRRRQGPAALRAAQQLAGQRQPGQGAPAALADQAEVWPEDFLGRPDDPHRQRRPGNDGIQDVRFRRRSRGRLGAGSGRLLGHRDDLAGRQDATPATGTSKIRSPPCRWV